MPLKFIYLNSPPVVTVHCYNWKAMGKKMAQKMIAQSLEKKGGQNGDQLLNH